MQQLPRNVFRVCPENTREPEPIRTRHVEPNEYTIYKASGREVLRIVKSNAGITLDELMKAAKCGKFKDFKAYRHANCSESTVIKASDFPIKSNIYLTKP